MREALTVLCATVLLTACVPRQEPLGTPEEPKAPGIPEPKLELMGFQAYEDQEEPVIRVLFSIRNYADFPDTLFAKTPELPPCEESGEAVRTWLQLYSREGVYLGGACSLESSKHLHFPSFTRSNGESMPAAAYAEIWDRESNTRYRSEVVPLIPASLGSASGGFSDADLAEPRSYYRFLGEAEAVLDDRFGPPTARYRDTREYLVEDRDDTTVVACFGVEAGHVAAAYIREATTERLMRCIGEPISR